MSGLKVCKVKAMQFEKIEAVKGMKIEVTRGMKSKSYKHLACLGNRQIFKISRIESNFSRFEVLRLSRTSPARNQSRYQFRRRCVLYNAATMEQQPTVDSARASPAGEFQQPSSIWVRSKKRVAVDFEILERKSMHQLTTRQFASLRVTTITNVTVEGTRRLEDVLSATYLPACIYKCSKVLGATGLIALIIASDIVFVNVRVGKLINPESILNPHRSTGTKH